MVIALSAEISGYVDRNHGSAYACAYAWMYHYLNHRDLSFNMLRV